MSHWEDLFLLPKFPGIKERESIWLLPLHPGPLALRVTCKVFMSCTHAGLPDLEEHCEGRPISLAGMRSLAVKWDLPDHGNCSRPLA